MKDSQTKKEGFLGQKMITLPPNIINEVEQNSLINGLKKMYVRFLSL